MIVNARRRPPLIRAGLVAGLLAGLPISAACPASPDPAAPAAPKDRGAAPVADDTVVAAAATGATLQVPGRVVVGSARAVVAAPLPLRLKRLLVQPGDVVGRGAAVAEVAIPEVAEAAAALRGARARRAVAVKRRDWLQALRAEGLPRVADELEADAELATLDAELARATALLRVVDVEVADAALDELATRGSVTLRAPVQGTVIAVGDATAGVVVGAVVPAGAVLASLAADQGDPGRVRVIVRLPVATTTPPTATALVGDGVALVALPGQGPVDLQDGANDRVFALAPPPQTAAPKTATKAAPTPAAPTTAAGPALVDGQGVTVQLPTTAKADAVLARLPAAAVRLGGDGVAVVAVVADGHEDGEARNVVVVGRVGGDLIVEGLAPGTRVKRDARAALMNAESGGGHAH